VIADGQGAPTSQIIGHGVGPLFVMAKLLITQGFRRDQPSLSTGILKVRHLDFE
jgi:hypothetical protein